MLRPAIVVALIFRTITAIQTFDIPYAMTNGGPGNSTETLAMYIHKTTVDFLDLGYGSALAVLMFLASAAITSVYLRHTRRDRGGTEHGQQKWIPVLCPAMRKRGGTEDEVLKNRRAMIILAGLIVAANGFFPALWILFTSFKTEVELMKVPITIIPQAPTIENYIRVFVDQPILRFLFNSVVVAVLSTLLCVFCSALAAYALVRLRLPAAGIILSTLLAIAMFPLISMMVPLFQVMRDLGLLTHLVGADLPACRALDAGLHARADLVLPGYPARP